MGGQIGDWTGVSWPLNPFIQEGVKIDCNQLLTTYLLLPACFKIIINQLQFTLYKETLFSWLKIKASSICDIFLKVVKFQIEHYAIYI